MTAKPKPGSRWRLLAHTKEGGRFAPESEGTFDELVVDDWLHVEHMGGRTWSVILGHCMLAITVGQGREAFGHDDRGARRRGRDCHMSVITISSPEHAAELYGAGSMIHDYMLHVRAAAREECTGRFVRAMSHWYDGDEKTAAALERHRAVLLNMATNETNAREDRMARVQDVFNVDKALLALADEEAKL